MKIVLSDSIPTIDGQSLTLCKNCYCMAKQVKGKCGKCGSLKLPKEIEDKLKTLTYAWMPGGMVKDPNNVWIHDQEVRKLLSQSNQALAGQIEGMKRGENLTYNLAIQDVVCFIKNQGTNCPPVKD